MAGTKAEWLAKPNSSLYDAEQCLWRFLGLLDAGEAKIEHISLTLTVQQSPVGGQRELHV